jgi:hypothetical protein
MALAFQNARRGINMMLKLSGIKGQLARLHLLSQAYLV